MQNITNLKKETYFSFKQNKNDKKRCINLKKNHYAFFFGASTGITCVSISAILAFKNGILASEIVKTSFIMISTLTLPKVSFLIAAFSITSIVGIAIFTVSVSVFVLYKIYVSCKKANLERLSIDSDEVFDANKISSVVADSRRNSEEEGSHLDSPNKEIENLEKSSSDE